MIFIKMRFSRLRSSCFVCDLKTCNIVMGCLNAIASFAIFVLFVVMANTLEPIIQATYKDEWALNFRAAVLGFYVLAIIFTVVLLIKFCFDILFIYGVAMEHTLIIRAYFIMWVVFLPVSVIMFFLHVTRYSIVVIVKEIFGTSVIVCAILLTHNFHKSLKKKDVIV